MTTDPKWQKLIEAIDDGNYDECRRLLKVAPIRTLSSSGGNLLHILCHKAPESAQRKKYLALLREAERLLPPHFINAKTFAGGEAPIHYAALSVNEVALAYLCSRPDVNINVQNSKTGFTALHYLAHLGAFDAIDLMFRCGANPYIVAQGNAQTSPGIAAEVPSSVAGVFNFFLERQEYESERMLRAASVGDTATFLTIAEQNAVFLHCHDEEGLTALHHFALNGDLNAVSTILSHPRCTTAVVNSVDKRQWTPLMCALSHGNYNTALALLDSGALADLTGDSLALSARQTLATPSFSRLRSAREDLVSQQQAESHLSPRSATRSTTSSIATDSIPSLSRNPSESLRTLIESVDFSEMLNDMMEVDDKSEPDFYYRSLPQTPHRTPSDPPLPISSTLHSSSGGSGGDGGGGGGGGDGSGTGTGVRSSKRSSYNSFSARLSTALSTAASSDSDESADEAEEHTGYNTVPKGPIVPALNLNMAELKKEKKTKNTPLHLCVRSQGQVGPSKRKKLAEVLERIVLQGARINATNHHGETALHVAVKFSNTTAVTFLLQQDNIRVNTRDLRGMTALDYADITTEVYKLLRSAGAISRNQPSAATFHELSDDVVLHIMSFLNEKDSSELALVCKSFTALIQENRRRRVGPPALPPPMDVDENDDLFAHERPLLPTGGETGFLRVLISASTDTLINDVVRVLCPSYQTTGGASDDHAWFFCGATESRDFGAVGTAVSLRLYGCLYSDTVEADQEARRVIARQHGAIALLDLSSAHELRMVSKWLVKFSHIRREGGVAVCIGIRPHSDELRNVSAVEVRKMTQQLVVPYLELSSPLSELSLMKAMQRAVEPVLRHPIVENDDDSHPQRPEKKSSFVSRIFNRRGNSGRRNK